jgi:hypothetical protein
MASGQDGPNITKPSLPEMMTIYDNACQCFWRKIILVSQSQSKNYVHHYLTVILATTSFVVILIYVPPLI